MPQLAGGSITLLGGVYMLRSLFESQPPQVDIVFLVSIFIASYLISCLIVWIYDTKINKVVSSIEEIDVPPPEERDDEETEEQ